MNTDQTAVIRGCIQHKLLSVGQGKLFVSYYRQRLYADILDDGSMQFKGKIYVNAASLALAMKRTLNPVLKTDPGWLSLFSTDNNKCLKDIREAWIEKITPPTPTSASTPSQHSTSLLTPSYPPVVGMSSSFMKPTVIRPKQHPLQVLGPRESCVVCKRDRGHSYVTCEACRSIYHKACLSPSVKNTTSPWYCEVCIQQHCALVLNFLQQLRQVAVQYGDQSVDKPTNEKATVSEVESSDTPAISEDLSVKSTNAEERPNDEPTKSPETPNEDPANSDEKPDNAEQPAEVEKDKSDNAVVDSASTELSPSSTLLTQIDSLVEQLQSPADCMSVLGSSTGELLVHLSHLDIATVLRSVEDHLSNVAATCSRENEPIEGSITTPGIEGMLQVLNLRHGIMSARFHLKRTNAALTTLSDKRLRACDKKQAALDEAYEKELKLKGDWASRVKDAEDDLKKQQTHLAQVNAIVDNAVRHRKTLRAVNLAKRFIPAYRTATEDLTHSCEHLFVTIVADKIRGIASSLKEWELMEEHFTSIKEVLSNSDERPFKMPKLEIELPRPPSAKLVERQLKEIDKNLDVIQLHKNEALKILETIDGALHRRLGKDDLHGEWKQLLDTIAEMIRKCQPPPSPERNETGAEHPVEANENAPESSETSAEDKAADETDQADQANPAVVLIDDDDEVDGDTGIPQAEPVEI
ncbi:unnamed protein product [Aphanomyces euteiches]